MLKATVPAFHYHTTISKTLAGLLFSKRLHIISSPSQSIIIPVQHKYTVFTIYRIKTKAVPVIWKIEAFGFKISLHQFSQKATLLCFPSLFMYSTQIPGTLHVQVIVKPRFLKAVCSQTYRTGITSTCQSHGRK